MILIDDRTGSRDLVSYLPLDSLGQLTRLDSGDIAFDGNGPQGVSLIGIELKRISDLIASRQSNRLQSIDGQLAAMLQDYDERWLLTYGTYRCNPQTGVLEHLRKATGAIRPKSGYEWTPYTFNGSRDGKPIPYSLVTSTLISLSDLGIRHHHVYDLQQAALWIATLHAKRQQSWSRQCHMFQSLNETKSVQESSYRRAIAGLKLADSGDCDSNGPADVSPMPTPIDPVEYQIAKVAAAFDTIKYKRAIALAKQFDSVEELMQAAIDADLSKLQEVDGIGKIIAREFVRAVKMSKTSKTRKPNKDTHRGNLFT